MLVGSGKDSALRGCLQRRIFRVDKKENTEDMMSATTLRLSCFQLFFFILQKHLKRTFLFLIAKDTSNQFEIKILQLVNYLDNYIVDVGLQKISHPSHSKDFNEAEGSTRHIFQLKLFLDFSGI